MKEINKLGIEEAAVFPTCFDAEKRKKFYRLLKKSRIKNIPFAHLRGDMKIKELDYFVKNFNTRVFCIHTAREFPIVYNYHEYKKMIYIENVYYPLSEKEVNDFGGVCVDFSHLENDRLFCEEKFKHNKTIIEKFTVGCNHISAVKNESYIYKGHGCYKSHKRCDYHHLEKLSEMDYLKSYPLKYFSSYMAVELENSLEEQLKVGEYIRKIIGGLQGEVERSWKNGQDFQPPPAPPYLKSGKSVAHK